MIQVAVSLLMLPLFLASFMYGGASEYPTRFLEGLVFLVLGVVSGLLLYRRASVGRRTLSCVWHAIFVAYLTSLMARALHELPAAFVWMASLPFPSAAYLLATSLREVAVLARKNPATTRRVVRRAAVVGPLLAGACAAYVYSWHSVRGLEWWLRWTDRDTRCAAAHELGEMGPAATSALPTLETMLDETNCRSTGEAADNTIADILAIGGVDPLLEVMRSGGPIARRSAAAYLRRLPASQPDRARDFKRVFTAGLSDADAWIRAFSAEGLAALGAEALDLLPRIRALAVDPDEQVRAAAQQAIAILERKSGAQPFQTPVS